MLFRALVRSTMLSMAMPPFQAYAPLWSTVILEELARNLRAKVRMPPTKVASLLDRMAATFPGAVVDPSPDVVRHMPNHRKDRHVLAVAVVAEADVLVTRNVRDFRGAEWLGVSVQTPDKFLSRLYDTQTKTVLAAIATQAAQLSAPPMTVDELVARLEQRGLPNFAARLRGSA